MTTSEIFNSLLSNLKVDNSGEIAKRRDEIVKVLNKEFRDLTSSTNHQLMVGSYGRHTAVKGISDLDLIYILPNLIRNSLTPRSALERTREALLERYPRTSVKVDGCVVVVGFNTFKFEVQPAFSMEDNSFSYPDKPSSVWKTTKPRAEIKALQQLNVSTNGNLRNLCRMVRSWRNAHGIAMGGLLIDTLVYNFFNSTEVYNTVSTSGYDEMVKDFFEYLSKEPSREYYHAPGSNQHVKVKKSFSSRAKKAYNLCVDATSGKGEVAEYKAWKEIFGKAIKIPGTSRGAYSYNDTEEFIEDMHQVDIKYLLDIDCEVERKGCRPDSLSSILRRKSPLFLNTNLKFFVKKTDAPTGYKIKWKVLNRGTKAQQLDNIRGQIVPGGMEQIEKTSFKGDHVVECYLIENNIVVARSLISVPIRS